ncbi:hypothetical protein WJX84_005777 [Apatococcus fuscideae]|uniref:Alcohol dehydrogenase-like N-terminal domain-containing protein n=1 Tax=Apatococcus fuscideae TaxID=2026836 RepID=A0AAW1TCA1_9CHLO
MVDLEWWVPDKPQLPQGRDSITPGQQHLQYPEKRSESRDSTARLCEQSHNSAIRGPHAHTHCQICPEQVAVPALKPDESGKVAALLTVRPKVFRLTPGDDLAGVVEEVGTSTKWKRGDRVFALTDGYKFSNKSGCYAEYMAVPEDQLAAIPAGMDFISSAAIPCTALTAWQIQDGHGGTQCHTAVSDCQPD